MLAGMARDALRTELSEWRYYDPEHHGLSRRMFRLWQCICILEAQQTDDARAMLEALRPRAWKLGAWMDERQRKLL